MVIKTAARLEEAPKLLEKIAQAGNRQEFVALAEAIDWSGRQPEELLKAIDLALSLELAALAIKLAQRGNHLFPDHKQIQQAARVLVPPVGREMSMPPTKGLTESHAWFRDHAHQYRGQWVAVREGKLLGAAESLQELIALIGEDKNNISTIVTKVL